MDAGNRSNQTGTSGARPTFSLVPREEQKPVMDPPPPPREPDEHPGDEPGYGHGV